ncbi:MAG: SH3 domain-containing protein [Hungatella hathewayi]
MTTRGNGSGETDALETLPVETSESLTPQGSGQASASTTAAGTKAATTTKAASTTKAAANYTVKDIESKTMYATKSVRVRESASTDSAVVGGLTPGQDVKATGETSNGWIRVSYNGGSAYVSKSYLSTTKPDTAKETTAAKKTTGNSSSNTTKTTKPAQESSAAAPTTAASSDETIAPFPG